MHVGYRGSFCIFDLFEKHENYVAIEALATLPDKFYHFHLFLLLDALHLLINLVFHISHWIILLYCIVVGLCSCGTIPWYYRSYDRAVIIHLVLPTTLYLRLLYFSFCELHANNTGFF